MGKNVLVLSGIPRKGGNSDLLCDEFVKGAEKAGNTAEKIFIREKISTTASVAIIAKSMKAYVQLMTAWMKY